MDCELKSARLLALPKIPDDGLGALITPSNEVSHGLSLGVTTPDGPRPLGG